MSKFEEVVKAIAIAEHQWWNSDEEPTNSLAETLARAAIEAMREPTQAMMDAYLDLEPMDDDYPYNPPAAKTAWQAMLDAALKEPGHE